MEQKKKARILIVENERIIAEDIKSCIHNMGFDLCAIVSSGEKAVEMAEAEQPDLVLMDIMLDGKMDGIKAANHIYSQFDIPVIYITACTDKSVLERAKATEPFGYILKPFEEKELYVTIEIALCKHKTEKEKKRSEEKLRRAYHNLEREVEKRTHELLNINERLTSEIEERKRTELEKEYLLDELQERIKELNCLYKISEFIDQTNIALEEIFQKTVSLIVQSWKWSDIACARIAFKESIFQTDNFKRTSWRQSADIKVFGKKKGCIEVCYLEKRDELDEGPFLKEERSLIEDIAARLGKFVERQTAKKELFLYQGHLRALSSQLLLTEERERRQIATELHDRIGQSLAISKLRLGFLKGLATSPELIHALDDIKELLDQTIQDTRTLTFEISPPVLYRLGLESAIEWLVEQIRQRHGICIEFEDDQQTKPLNNAFRVLIFRAARELLLNIVKHAHAQNAKVSVQREGENIRIEIRDDGVGFQVSDVIKKAYRGSNLGGFGIFSVRERLNDLGGSFEIISEPGKGTRVILISPLNQNKEIPHKEINP